VVINKDTTINSEISVAPQKIDDVQHNIYKWLPESSFECISNDVLCLVSELQRLKQATDGDANSVFAALLSEKKL
jgi:hypothetical protein